MASWGAPPPAPPPQRHPPRAPPGPAPHSRRSASPASTEELPWFPPACGAPESLPRCSPQPSPGPTVAPADCAAPLGGDPPAPACPAPPWACCSAAPAEGDAIPPPFTAVMEQAVPLPQPLRAPGSPLCSRAVSPQRSSPAAEAAAERAAAGDQYVDELQGRLARLSSDIRHILRRATSAPAAFSAHSALPGRVVLS
eukprot:TRINITY_DN26786_c0_g1_i2.p3 TRINITY_DN26786_c0_g1~~TRINITY_DN26786_c0_g1_i2.p3  ORF type:complete len:197 (+),score=15.50 TRINITY_DN26786_c0_g1_i2:292-882(+)